MDNGVQQQFPESVGREKEPLLAIDSLVTHQRLHVFRENQVHRPLDLNQKRSMDFVLVQNIRFGREKANLYIRSRNPAFRVRIETHHGRPCQMATFGAAEILEKILHRDSGSLFIETLRFDRLRYLRMRKSISGIHLAKTV